MTNYSCENEICEGLFSQVNLAIVAEFQLSNICLMHVTNLDFINGAKRERNGLMSSDIFYQKFAFHWVIKVREFGEGQKKHVIQAASSGQSNFSNLLWFGV